MVTLLLNNAIACAPVGLSQVFTCKYLLMFSLVIVNVHVRSRKATPSLKSDQFHQNYYSVLTVQSLTKS